MVQTLSGAARGSADLNFFALNTAMRDYAKVSAKIWIGKTGRQIRAAGGNAQRLALYLISGPNANMIGLYYIPISTMAYEVGMTVEEADKSLEQLCAIGLCKYDRNDEIVFVMEMARFQIGEELKPSDKQIKGVVRELEVFRNSPFFKEFYDRYRERFFLPDPSPQLGLPIRGLEAPSKPLRSQEQEQEQEHAQDQEHEHEHEQEHEQEKGVKFTPKISQIESIYKIYPRQVARDKALDSIAAAAKKIAARGQIDPIGWLRDRVGRYARAVNGKEHKWIPHCATWMNNGRYDDDEKEWGDHGGNGVPPVDPKTRPPVRISHG